MGEKPLKWCFNSLYAGNSSNEETKQNVAVLLDKQMTVAKRLAQLEAIDWNPNSLTNQSYHKMISFHSECPFFDFVFTCFFFVFCFCFFSLWSDESELLKCSSCWLNFVFPPPPIPHFFPFQTNVVLSIEYEYSHRHKILSDCTILTHLSSFNIRLHSLNALKQLVNWRKYCSNRKKNELNKKKPNKISNHSSNVRHVRVVYVRSVI